MEAPREGTAVRRYQILLFAGGAALSIGPALAADALKFGPAPNWVRQQPVVAASAKGNPDAPVAVLLKDEQIRFDRGKTISYSEGAIQYQIRRG